jgi:hypothetical protein
MANLNRVLTGALLAAAAFTAVGSGVRAADAPKPAVEGKWTGTWGLYNPADQGKPNPYAKVQMKLDCTVEARDGKYQAVFEGDAGRPYKYTIKMEGRAMGPAVLFKGTADLGPMDGGVYDWIGRANEKEFVGFYTSAGHVGTFTLSRVKETAKDAAQ